MTQPITLTELGPAGFRPAISQFVAVYAAAMNPPQRMLSGRESILERHAANPGFRAFAALAECGTHGSDGTAGSGPVLAGFTYGFHGEPGQWWHDMVAGALASYYSPGRSLARSPRTGVSMWLSDSFEVAELHVLPAYQGAGIGRRLLLALTSGRPERTAVLSTMDGESRARRLYRGVGFTDLLTAFRFSGGEPPYAVMGAVLPLSDRPVRDTAFPPSPAPSRPAPPWPARPSSW